MSKTLHPHRHWLLACLLAITILFAAPLLTGTLRNRNAEQNRQLEARLSTVQKQMEQWEADARTAKELNAALKGEKVATYLAPISRAELSAQLEPLAGTAHISRLTYSLGPEQIWTGNASFAHMKGLIQSTLTIEGEAPIDQDVLDFIKSLSTLPGRMELQQLSMTRIGGEKNQSLSLRNITFKATLLWISNGGSPQEAAR